MPPPHELVIVFSPHAVSRLQQRVPQGDGLAKGAFVRLMLVRNEDGRRKPLWMLRIRDGVLLGSLRRSRKRKHVFLVITVLDLAKIRVRQRQDGRQFIPIEARLFRIKRIGAAIAQESVMSNGQIEKVPFAFTITRGVEIDAVWPTLAAAVDAAGERYPHPSGNIPIHAWFPDGTSRVVPDEFLFSEDRKGWISQEDANQLERKLFGTPTVRQQVTALLRRNPDADYWEKLILRFTDYLLAQVDEQLRGIPVEDSGIEKMTVKEFQNIPHGIELLHGIPTPKHWSIRSEGLRRLGFTSSAEEWDLMRDKSVEEIAAEYRRRRAELRARPFVASQVPFPSGPPEEY
jgi:hypothetical protein